MKDAIVYSTWSWDAFNVPERIALALAHLGARVLYCEHPASIFRAASSGPREVEPGVLVFRPAFIAERMNRIPGVRSLQAMALARQICRQAEALKMRSPAIFLYPWLGEQFCLLPYLRDKFAFAHIQMDFGEPNIVAHVEMSDVTLVIPRAVYHQQRGRFGEKIRIIPQVSDMTGLHGANGSYEPDSAVCAIPRPRLGYLGSSRINKPLVSQLLQRHPEWHFVSVGQEKAVDHSNAHVLPWRKGREVWKYAAGFDVGFMPYDCFEGHSLHGAPLKLLDYFALGLPVVSTPIIELWDLRDLVYLGDTPEELEHAVGLALQEPPDSPKRKRRMEFARSHSIPDLADALRRALPLE